MKSFKDYIEEVAASSVAGGGVDLTPSADQIFFKKRDKRKKEDTDAMYRRSLGLKHIKDMIERRKK
jgi:hypothetical protein